MRAGDHLDAERGTACLEEPAGSAIGIGDEDAGIAGPGRAHRLLHGIGNARGAQMQIGRQAGEIEMRPAVEGPECQDLAGQRTAGDDQRGALPGLRRRQADARQLAVIGDHRAWPPKVRFDRESRRIAENSGGENPAERREDNRPARFRAGSRQAVALLSWLCLRAMNSFAVSTATAASRQ